MCDIDLEPMTLIVSLDPDIKMYLHSKEEVCSLRHSKVRRQAAYIDTVCYCDTDRDPMTLTYKLDLDVPRMYLHVKNQDSS